MATENTQNNFKELEKINVQEFPHAVSEIENGVMGTVRGANVVGSIVDLYIGKLFSTISSLFGAKVEAQKTDLPKNVNQDNDYNTPNGDSK